MATYYLKKLLGGAANGLDVPANWKDGTHVFTFPGEAEVEYSQRPYYSGDDIYYVWVEVSVEHKAFIAMMWWYREMLRTDVIQEQKNMLQESMTSAQAYTNIIMVVGYAALFTLWTQTKGTLTAASTLSAGILIAVSALFFVGWEVFGMVVRSKINIALAKAVSDPFEYERRMMNFRDDQQAFARRFYPIWAVVVSIAVVFAIAGFIVLLSGMLHGTWIEFLKVSMKLASPH